MCATCGCDGIVHEHDDEGSGFSGHASHEHHHDHGHRHDHGHHHGPGRHRTLKLEAELLAKNDRLASQNRQWFESHGVFAVNLMGAPGAGKTALLEALIGRLAPRVPVAVLEGDQDTDRDAARVRATGAPVVQINTGAGCHLDAHMVHHGVAELRPLEHSILFIENVGNLVCPALFALGEATKAVVLSVTEGDDKPLKYPHMFRGADVVIINKIDLQGYVDFAMDSALEAIRALSPGVRVFMVSARRGDGLEELSEWLGSRVSGRMSEPSATSVESQDNGERLADAGLHQTGERIEQLLDELAGMVAPHVWARIEELLSRTVALYGAGLERLLSLARTAGARDLSLRACEDDLVSSLLGLHGLHPLPPLERAKRAFDRAAPALLSHGLAVEAVDVVGGEARVRVVAAGESKAARTPDAARLALIESIVQESAPELAAVRVEGMPAAPAQLVQLGLGRRGRSQRGTEPGAVE